MAEKTALDRTITVGSLEELERFVTDLSLKFSTRQIVLFEGPLAAGKTTSIGLIVKGRGGVNTSSPTFAIHHVYEAKIGEIDHVDLYRLENLQDLESTGFWDIFGKKSGLVLIEWSDRLAGDWFPVGWDVLKLVFTVQGDQSRAIQVSSVR